MDEKKRQQVEDGGRQEIERLAIKLKDLILSQPPLELLGYVYSRMLLNTISANDTDKSKHKKHGRKSKKRHEYIESIEKIQFVLEFMHAALSSFDQGSKGPLSEKICVEIFSVAEQLLGLTLLHCMLTSQGSNEGVFGPKTGEVEFIAKTNWVLLRGNRHQVLEGEFFTFVLAPHDKALRDAYGIDSKAIAAGFQSIADSVRTGHMLALEEFHEQMEAALQFAAESGLTLEQAAEAWQKKQPEKLAAFLGAFEDLFQGGICNVSKHTDLPSNLLEDLSFQRGEDTEFFASGPYCGTPLRTLPARKKPLIKLGEEYFAIDPCFARDSGYRALLWNLQKRKPEYKKEFETRQKQMSEAAFFQVFSDQLNGASVYQEVWYKDPVTRQWVENDTLITLDDVLILVEAKAGAAATIASPALDFERHIRSVQDLVTKAHIQCRRFFDYLNSAAEVPLFRREKGKYVEFSRISLADYRVALPIGLTVESFSPFSAMCKELPTIEPILGLYPFISLSIDDLLVLSRFLPSTGELIHYLEVRQSIAGIKGTRLFDETDHLGAYISKNRFDMILREQLSEGADLVLWDGMSEIVDTHFEHEDWETRAPPKSECPEEVTKLLNALNSTKDKGWLSSESCIRNYGHEGRQNLSSMLQQHRESLAENASRYFSLFDTPPLFVWLQREGSNPDLARVQFKAKAVAIAANSPKIVAVLAFATPGGDYIRAKRISVFVPTIRSVVNADIFADAERMKSRYISNSPGRKER